MTPEKITHLISQYMAGETTLRQERQIYAYFRKGDIAPSLRRYAAFFRDMAEADGALSAPAPRRIAWRSFMPRAAAAVALLALLGAGTALLYRQHLYDQLADRYEGSYMIVGGKRTDNIIKIHKQLSLTISEADETERRVSRLKSVEETEHDVLHSIDDPEIRAAIEHAYND